jgi:hypothetical protein
MISGDNVVGYHRRGVPVVVDAAIRIAGDGVVGYRKVAFNRGRAFPVVDAIPIACDNIIAYRWQGG